MAIIYAANFAELMGYAAGHTVDAVGRDAAFTPAGIALPFPGDFGVSCDLASIPTSETLWVHGRFTPAVGANSLSPPGTVMRVLADTAEFAVGKQNNGANIFAQVTTASATAGSNYLISGATNVTYEVDMKCNVSGGNVTSSLYINGALQSTATRAGTPAFYQEAYWGNAMGARASSAANTIFLNEMIVATEDTRGMRVATLPANAAGTYAEWSGASANLADYDALSGVTVATAGPRQSRIHAAAPAGTVRAIVAQSRYFGTPTNSRLSHLLRISGTNYFGAIKAPGVSAPGAVVGTVFDVNPATGLAWTTADLAALEAGFRAEL